MYKSVLVGVDGSAFAHRAVEVASAIAKTFGAKVTLVHSFAGDAAAGIENMVPVPGAPDLPGMYRALAATEDATTDPTQALHQSQRRREIGDQILEHEKETLLAQGVKTVETLNESGDPAEVIVDCADREKADLIVVGTRGLGRLKGLLMGSVSHKVSQHAPCSCLTVR